MSRRDRDADLSALAARELAAAPPDGAVLVIGDPTEILVDAVRAAGLEVVRWDRRAFGGRRASAWPEGGPYALAALRLPRAKQELEMAATAAASLLRPGGILQVFGANDEGIRSAGRRLTPPLASVGTLAVGGHGRLLAGALDGDPPSSTLEAWRTVDALDLPWGRVPWVSWPGVFAHGRLDPGTALLLEHLPEIPDGATVLDYGAGSGFLSAGVRAVQPDAGLVLLEIDAVAAAAARENVSGAEIVVGDGGSGLPADRAFDVLVSNPPYHRGKSETLDAVRDWLETVERHMAKDGTARFVVQRRLPVEACTPAGLALRPVADAGPYRVFEVVRVAGSGAGRRGRGGP